MNGCRSQRKKVFTRLRNYFFLLALHYLPSSFSPILGYHHSSNNNNSIQYLSRMSIIDLWETTLLIRFSIWAVICLNLFDFAQHCKGGSFRSHPPITAWFGVNSVKIKECLIIPDFLEPTIHHNRIPFMPCHSMSPASMEIGNVKERRVVRYMLLCFWCIFIFIKIIHSL